MRNFNVCIKANNGFTLIEVMIALLVVSISMLLFTPIVQVMYKMSMHSYESEDILAIQQLRFILAQSYDIQSQQDTLQMRYHQEHVYVQFHNNRLVKRPGYEILLQDIDEAYVQWKGGCHELSYRRKETVYIATLACE